MSGDVPEVPAVPPDPGPDDLIAAAAVPPPEAKPPFGFAYDEKAIESVFGKPEKDGRPANVQAKYWDADKKALKADVVFSQLKWAEGKLGKKLEVIGAPEKDYAIELPENSPVAFNADDPAVKGFLAVARKHDVSQSFVTEVVTEVAKLLESATAMNVQAEIGKLGEKGRERLKDMGDYLAANLAPEQAAVLQSALTSAPIFEALEAVIKKSAPPNFLQKGEDQAAPGGKMTVQQWNELNFAVDEFGNRKRSVDPAYNKMVEDMRDEVFGVQRRNESGRPVNDRGVPA